MEALGHVGGDERVRHIRLDIAITLINEQGAFLLLVQPEYEPAIHGNQHVPPTIEISLPLFGIIHFRLEGFRMRHRNPYP